jgi:hypothetical protein
MQWRSFGVVFGGPFFIFLNLQLFEDIDEFFILILQALGYFGFLNLPGKLFR